MGKRHALARILAGIQVGVFAGLAILAWMVLGSLVTGYPAWRIPNLLAYVFYGPVALNSGFGLMTVGGIAVHLLQCVAGAVVFSLLAPRGSYGRTLILSLAFVFALGWISKSFVWKSLMPYLLRLAPPFVVWAGFAMFGFALSLLPWIRSEMEDGFLVD